MDTPKLALQRTAGVLLILLLAVMILAFIGLGVLIWFAALSLQEEFPQYASATVPMLTLTYAILACAVLFMVFIMVLAEQAIIQKIFQPSSLRVLSAMIVTALVAAALTVCLQIAIPGSPVKLFIVAVELFEVCVASLVMVMRCLLKQAVAFRGQLDGARDELNGVI